MGTTFSITSVANHGSRATVRPQVATRVFIVYDPVRDRCVLMKDTWRVSLDGMQTEGAIYKRLHTAGVSNIPHFLRGSDVTSPFCRTRSHKFARQFNLQLQPHSHYQFTLEDIGRDKEAAPNDWR